jgi:hypothetical protein
MNAPNETTIEIKKTAAAENSVKAFKEKLVRYRAYVADLSAANPDWKIFVFSLRTSFIVELVNSFGFKMKPTIYWKPTNYFLAVYFFFGAALALIKPDSNAWPIGGGLFAATLFTIHRNLILKIRNPKDWSEI